MGYIESDNRELVEWFEWCKRKAGQYVVTGRKNAPINDGRAPARDYMPCFWAAHRTRTAFYSRDYMHSSLGASFLGYNEENYNMMMSFIRSATKERGYFAYWSINFDGETPYDLDFKDDNYFVREIPPMFELVEHIYRQYLWTGDERYLSDEVFDFCTRTLTTFIRSLDTDGNGIPEGTNDTDLSTPYATYDERTEIAFKETGDEIACLYQAMMAYAGLNKARGNCDAYDVWMKKAEDLKKYFNEEWSVMPGDPDGHYVCGIDHNGKKYNHFAVETSVFMPLKSITAPGERTREYLQHINRSQGTGIGFESYDANMGIIESSHNIEGYTYYPELFYMYNDHVTAWKWMKYIDSMRHKRQEGPNQGPNGYYPELSFTMVSNTISGMMGVEVDVPANRISTLPRLPDDIRYVTLEEQKLGNHTVELMHCGRTFSSLTNLSETPLVWRARFIGEYSYIYLNGVPTKSVVTELNGQTISYVETTVMPYAICVARLEHDPYGET